jgi:hypothetical protein
MLAAVCAVLTLLLGGISAPAYAEPTTPPNEGSTPTQATLRQNLQAASAGYLEAEATLEASRKRQIELDADLATAQTDLTRLRQIVGLYAAEAYKTGRLGVIGMMVNTNSPDAFLAKANALDKLTQRDQAKLTSLMDTQHRATVAKAEIDLEVKKQTDAVTEMTKRKTAAEKALAAVGSKTTTGYVNPKSALAKPAPRNANGSWPSESCTIADPTTSGCISPRTLHAMNEAKANGFTHYVSCYRGSGGGDHPRGKACDFSAAAAGFANKSASGADRTYGDNLASFFIKNASRLGVSYVIWYCKIWITGAWKTYSSAGSNCGDSPAGDHTNHVHLSML